MNHSSNTITIHESFDVDIIYTLKISNMIVIYESFDVDIIYTLKISNMIVMHELSDIDIIYALKSQNTLDFHDLSKNRSLNLQLLSIYIRKVILDLLLFDFDEKDKNVLTRKQ